MMRSVRSIDEKDVKDLETRGRYLRRKGFGGYRCEEVDIFLVEALTALRELLRENEGLRAGVSGFATLAGRMTLFDVQDARFHHVRVGGYDMRAADDYLDDLSDVLTALIQENEQLRSASSISSEGKVTDMWGDAAKPRDDGFAMPAEFSPHQATWISWPARGDLWGGRLDEAKDEWAATARAIAGFEPVTMVCDPGQAEDVRNRCGSGVEPLEVPIDDSWLRDNGPIFVSNPSGEVALVQFGFNSWGGKYLPFDRDAALPEALAAHFGVRRYVAPFVLEGGSFFVDGEGTVLTTEQCLLNPNRNPSMSRGEIEEGLRSFLGVDTVIWLPHGLVEDRDTDGHVDGLAQYVRPGAVMLATAAGPNDPNAERFQEDRGVLTRTPDARGRSLEVLEGPVNSWAELPEIGPIVIPYMNHYLVNGGVIVPVGGVPADEPALELLAKAYPDREVVGVPGAWISHGGGGPHCITQQVPAGTFVS